jgi:hypothetical protein
LIHAKVVPRSVGQDGERVDPDANEHEPEVVVKGSRIFQFEDENVSDDDDGIHYQQ